MHLIICNERLLFRFGVDRVLLLLAQGLKAQGWRITFVAQRVDEKVLSALDGEILSPPAHTGPYLDLDRVTAQWLAANRSLLLPPGQAPQKTVAIIGGWPFYSSIPLFRQWGVPTVALDCGGVPFDDLQGPARTTQERLRSLRREYLPEARVVTPISDFIARTQSLPDAGGEAEIVTILLGADHLDFLEEQIISRGTETADTALSANDKASRFILNLGRWETGNYKNSEALFPIARRIIQTWPLARFGVLASAHDLNVPEDLQAHIVPLGHPDDAELSRIMREADLGLSVSLWEGFNLPLAEMQRLYKPVLAFNIGAHPEVAAHPDQLCADQNVMVERAIGVLAGELLHGEQWRVAVDSFRQRFTWQRTVDSYAQLLGSLGVSRDESFPRVVVDASACLRDPANTGVARVVRSLSRKLQVFGQPLFVAWDEQLKEYVLPTEDEYRNLGLYGGPDANPEHYRLPRSLSSRRLSLAAMGQRLRDTWLLQGEIVFERQGPERRAAARALGMKVAAIFYDAIPVTHPEFVADQAIRENHAAYMSGLAACDRVLPISPDAGRELRAFWQRTGIVPKAHVQPCWIPGELTGAPRSTTLAALPAANEPLQLLCVSTLEPRKNHAVLLAALEQLKANHPELNWRLDLVGNRYAGADAIADSVRQAAASDAHIVWHGVVDDQRLNELYAQAHITIYPSLVEGYGMPIVESLWHARPCICHHQGVMAELAEQGGCEIIDMTQPAALAAAIAQLAAAPARYRQLVEQAISRPILTWRSYARALLGQLARHAAPAEPLPRQWQHLVVPADQLLSDNSDQVALAALLSHRQVHSAVLLGRQPGWLLALFGRLVSQAWLLDATESAEVNLIAHREGVSCLPLAPLVGLPVLANELACANCAPQLIMLGAELTDPAESLRAIVAARNSLSSAVLVIAPSRFAQEIFQGYGLTVCIELPGMLGYDFAQDAPEPLA